ncbi:MAG TPA: HAD-IB family hydrolase [Candidatus Acidoferrales bacterium]|nr:HAD-IB family hydrolase [Candidatus Acidoferrales bacterium]
MSRRDGVGAFFDLDGTLLAAPSAERRFIFHLLTRGWIGPAQFARWGMRFIADAARDPRKGMAANKRYFSGVPTRCGEEWSRYLALHPVKLFSDGLDRLEFHFAQGHRIFLITGAPAPLAELVASYFPVPLTIVGTELEVCDGLWTGEIVGEHLCGAAKRRAIVRLAALHGLDQERSFAYGDSGSDLPMLETVGHPAAVNPLKDLERAARARGWPVLCWRELRRGRHWNEIRNPRVENSRGTGAPLTAVDANFMQSMNRQGINR